MGVHERKPQSEEEEDAFWESPISRKRRSEKSNCSIPRIGRRKKKKKGGEREWEKEFRHRRKRRKMCASSNCHLRRGEGDSHVPKHFPDAERKKDNNISCFEKVNTQD